MHSSPITDTDVIEPLISPQPEQTYSPCYDRTNTYVIILFFTIAIFLWTRPHRYSLGLFLAWWKKTRRTLIRRACFTILRRVKSKMPFWSVTTTRRRSFAQRWSGSFLLSQDADALRERNGTLYQPCTTQEETSASKHPLHFHDRQLRRESSYATIASSCPFQISSSVFMLINPHQRLVCVTSSCLFEQVHFVDMNYPRSSSSPTCNTSRTNGRCFPPFPTSTFSM